MIRKFALGASVALLVCPAAAGPLEDGQAAYDKGDYKTAAQDFTVAASQGDDAARAHLGTMFAYGIGVPQDQAQALFWLGLAAEHNNPEADTVLGKMSMDGRFVKQDPDQAFQFFQRAANQGMAIAETYLGELYLKGTPKVKADMAEAQRYLSMAAYQNEPESEYYLGFIDYTGMGGVKQDYVASAGWFTKSANQGNSAAATFLGTQYDKGLGTGQDTGKAIQYYRIAAVQGNLQGMGLLGEHYMSGQGVTQDTQRAYMFLNLTAGQTGSVLHDTAVKERDAAAAKLTQPQIDAAQKLGAFCGLSGFLVCVDDSLSVTAAAADPQADLARLQAKMKSSAPQTASGAAPAASGKPELIGNGTGFYINGGGDVVTAGHVARECPELRAQGVHLKLIAFDSESDVAVLSSDAKPANFIKLRGGRGPRVGEAVVAVGFPLQGILGQDAIVTTGIVSSLAGLKNDRRFIQISAPIQPGNSGGPIIGEDGSLLGVLSSQLDPKFMAEATGGQLPQNVNFAAGVSTLQSFLNAHQISYSLSEGAGPKKSSAEIASEAQRYTLMLECWK